MTETSKRFHALSQERVFMGDVTVILPSSWTGTECAMRRVDPGVIAPPSESADIRVTGHRHPTFGSRPVAAQFGQCGVPGLYLQLPHLALTTNQTLSSETLDSMLKEWIKFQFGVFEEHGFADDPLYPASYVEGEVMRQNRACNVSDEVGGESCLTCGTRSFRFSLESLSNR